MSIASLIPVLGPAIDKLIGLIPDTNARSQAAAEYQRALLDAIAAESQGQRQANAVEAAHRSIFVAGWRPAIGWVCASALAYQYVARPLAMWGLAIWSPDTPALPTLDGMLWELIMGMLGMGGLRTIDKLRGVAR